MERISGLSVELRELVAEGEARHDHDGFFWCVVGQYGCKLARRLRGSVKLLKTEIALVDFRVCVIKRRILFAIGERSIQSLLLLRMFLAHD